MPARCVFRRPIWRPITVYNTLSSYMKADQLISEKSDLLIFLSHLTKCLIKMQLPSFILIAAVLALSLKSCFASGNYLLPTYSDFDQLTVIRPSPASSV